MRDAAGLAPPLSWLAVWNRQLIARVDDEDEDNDNDDDESQAIDHIHRAGVLYSKSYTGDRALLARRIGLAQGLVDFTRSFARKQARQETRPEDPPPTNHIDPSKDIKVVQSQNQRLVFLQPESEFWIVAAFDRYLPQTTLNPSAETSGKPSHKTPPSQPAKLHPASFLPNQVLADLLKRAYAEYRLFNGTFAYMLDSGGQEKLQTKITAFFDAWQDDARLIPLGIPRAQPSSAHQFLQPPSGYTIVAVSHSGILDTSSNASTSEEVSDHILTPSDHLALSCHLASFLPKTKPLNSNNSTTTALTTSNSSVKGKGKKVKKQPSLSSSTWKSLHLSGITNYLPSMPSMPGTSSSLSNPPSISNLEGQDNAKKTGIDICSPKISSASVQLGQVALKAQHNKRTPSGSAWIPTFSLFGTSSSSSKEKDTVPKQEIFGQVDSTPPDTLHDQAQTMPENSAPDTAGERPELPTGDPPNSAASEASMEALSEAILETISPEAETSEALATEDRLALDTPPNEQSDTKVETMGAKPDPSVQSKFRATWHDVCTVYIGDEFTPVTSYRLSSDDIAMALICRNAESSESMHPDEGLKQDIELDKAVINQYFTHLATLQAYPPPSAMPQNPRSRIFLSFENADASKVIEQSIDDRASATNASLGQRYNLAINAKTDTDKLMKPDTRELFVRTHFSQWLVAEQEPKSDDIAKLTILPKSIGREGSLLDADAEMHRGR